MDLGKASGVSVPTFSSPWRPGAGSAGCGCGSKVGRGYSMWEPLVSEQSFRGGQAWADPVLWAQLLPGTICLEPPLLDLRPSTRSLKVTLRASGKASSGASSAGSVASWP